MSSTAHGTTPYYFVPQPSRHPVMASIGLFLVILGAAQWINGIPCSLAWHGGFSCFTNGLVSRFVKAKAGNMAARLTSLTAGA